MSKITLKPLDDGQKAVEIPIGKTTIGRGVFLGCSDKKVSRNHAVLEVTDAREVFITPTHVNPCFYQPTADSPGIILKKDKPQKLSNGDSFSLLPRAFRYQLIVTGESGEKKTSNQNDFKIQSEKTNGETNSSEESLKESKDTRDISKSELNDTATGKQLPKDDGLPANASKENSIKNSTSSGNEEKEPNYDSPEKDRSPSKDLKGERPQADDSFTKDRASESKDKFNDPEDEEEDDEEEEDEDDEEPLEDKNGSSKKESDIAEKEDKDAGTDGKPLEKEEKSVVEDKVTEESESTLGNDAFVSKEEKAQKEGSSSNLKDHETEEKSDVNSSPEKSESNKDIEEPPKESIEDDEDKSRTLPDWLEDMPVTTKRGGGRKKSQTPKQPKKEKTPAKRKSDGVPKTKTRKKVSKFNFDDAEEGSSQRRVAERTSSRTNRQTRQGLSLEDFVVSDDDEWQSDRSEQKPRRKRGSRRGNDSGSDWEIEHKRTKKGTPKVGSGSESGSDWGTKKKKQGLKGKRRKGKSATQSETGSEVEADPSSSFVAKDEKRIPCTYGKKCYRKNPNHTDQFSHPGDSDYASEVEVVPKKNDAISESEGEEDAEVESTKKECPYGSNCFRKNPQHKKNFKHTKNVRPQREAAKQASKKAKGSRSSDEVDNYDLNDSFLNDDSDEYKPVDSGSDYETKGKVKRFSKGKITKNKRGKRV